MCQGVAMHALLLHAGDTRNHNSTCSGYISDLPCSPSLALSVQVPLESYEPACDPSPQNRTEQGSAGGLGSTPGLPCARQAPRGGFPPGHRSRACAPPAPAPAHHRRVVIRGCGGARAHARARACPLAPTESFVSGVSHQVGGQQRWWPLWSAVHVWLGAESVGSCGREAGQAGPQRHDLAHVPLRPWYAARMPEACVMWWWMPAVDWARLAV